MATLQAMLAEVSAAVVTLLAPTQRMRSDIRDDLEAIPLGATRFQLRGAPAGVSLDSNENATLEALEVVILHHLDNPDGEAAYADGILQTHLTALISPTWWRALSAVSEVATDPEIERDREGNVVITLVRVTVSVT